MAVTLVQHKKANASSSTGSVTLTFTSTATAGNLLVIWVGTGDTGAITFTSGYTSGTQTNVGAGSSKQSGCFFWKVADGTETAITATFASTIYAIDFMEYSTPNGWAATPKNVEGITGQNASGTNATPSKTTTANGLPALIVCGVIQRGASVTFSAQKINASTTNVHAVGDDVGQSAGSMTTYYYDGAIANSSAYQGSETPSANAVNVQAIVVFDSLQTAPTVALGSPADLTTGVSATPDLNFTGTDAQGDTIEYEVQVDAANTFDSAGSTPTRVQGTTGTTGATFPSSLTTSNFGSAVSGGNAIIVGVMIDGLAASRTLTVTDSAGNSYINVSTKFQANIGQVDVWIATGVTGGGSFNITVGNLGGTTAAIIAEEWSGVVSASALDQQTTALGTATSAMSVGPTSATTNAKDVIWLAFGATGGTTTTTTATGFSNATSRVSSPSILFVQSKVVSSTGTQSASTTLSGSPSWEACIVAIKSSNGPLLDKLSSTPDATFTDVTNGAHTHPFPSGEQVKYTVQAGDAFTAGATYYWRVRGKDPSGTNTFGSWATTRSFTVFISSGASYTETLSETLSLTPTLIKQGRKKLSQTLSLTASLLRQLSRGLAQTLTLTPSLAASRLLSRPMTLETLSMSAALLRQPRKVLSATLSLTTTLARQPGRRFAEAATLTASLRKQLARSLSEMISETSSVAMARAAHVTPSVTLTLTGSLIRGPRKTLPETATLTATLARRAGKRAAEALALTDTTLRALNRRLAESVALTASLAKRAGKVLVGSTTLSATLGRSSSRALAEALTLLASLLKRAGKRLAAGTTLTATFNAVKATVKTISETIAATDTLVRAAALVLSDRVILTGSLARQLGRRIQETLTATATLARQARKNLTEAVAASDAMIRTATAVLTDPVSISASLVRQSRIALRETISLAATFARAIARGFFEALTLSGQLAKQAGVFTQEVLALIDQVSSSQNRAALTKLLSETLTLTDSIAEAFTKAKKAMVILATKAARAVLRLATKTDPAALTTRAATIELPTSVTSVELPTDNKPTTL